MWYSITISVLLVLCLVLYFVFSKKLKMPTVATEIMTTKYNNKLTKLERFCKINKLKFDKQKYLSSTIDSNLTCEKLIKNVEVIANIFSNYESIEDIFASSSKNEAQTKINRLFSIAPLKIFADELKTEKNIYDMFATFNINFSKLNFEFQKYFGSQQYVDLGTQKVTFLDDERMIAVDETNIFETKTGNYRLEVSNKNNESNEKSSDSMEIYCLKLYFNGSELFNKQVFVDNKKVKQFIEKSKYYIKN